MVAELTAASRRLFLAVRLPDDTRHALAAHLGAATGGKPLPGRPVRPENWHLTLRFLGTVDEVGAEVLAARVDEAELGGPFRIGFGGIGAFPRPARATVLWLGVASGAEPLVDLAAAVEAACVGAGFAAEERPFHPHVTLSRIRPHQDVRPVIGAVPSFAGHVDVGDVTLYQSRLGRGGARYQEVERFPLG